MINRILFLTILSIYSLSAAAQTDSIQTRIFNQYIGVQVNPLIKEVINLGSSTSVPNPYLLTYGFFYTRWNLGLEIGAGVQVSTLEETDSPINRSTRLNQMNFRAGLGRKISVGKLFLAGIGLDYIYESSDILTKTTSEQTNSFQSIKNVSEIKGKANGMGGGVRLNIAMSITKKIQLGTEVGYYYVASKEKDKIYSEITTVHLTSGVSTFNIVNESPTIKTSRFSLNAPVALFLIVKF